MDYIAEREPPFSKRPNWWLFGTGGLLTAGGLGWCLHVASIEHPKEALISYSAGALGVYLTNIAVSNTIGKKYSEIPVGNWMLMIAGGVISGSGFGYCLQFGLKEQPTSTLIGYTIGSIGYIMVNAALYTMTENVETEMSRKKRLAEEKIMKQVYKMIESSRFNFMTNNSCQYCELIVKKKDRERKEAAKQSKVMSIVTRTGGGLWNLMKFGLCMGRIFQDGVKQELSLSIIDKNNKVLSDRIRETEKCENKTSNGNQIFKKGVTEAYFGRSAEIVSAADSETSIKRKTNSDQILDLIGDEEEEYCGPTDFPCLFSDMTSTLKSTKLMGYQAEKSADSESESESESESDTEAELAEKEAKIISDILVNQPQKQNDRNAH